MKDSFLEEIILELDQNNVLSPKKSCGSNDLDCRYLIALFSDN
jgi:hypothetical protein